MTIIRTQASVKLPMPTNKNDLHQKIKTLETAQEKRELIEQTNPLLYLFGVALNPKHYLADEENDDANN